jgi:hypothetical protein
MVVMDRIEGLKIIAGHKVYETLPAFSVDLDKACVVGWLQAQDDGDIDDIIDSGSVDGIAWAKCKPFDGGFFNVHIDSDKVSADHIEALASAGII